MPYTQEWGNAPRRPCAGNNGYICRVSLRPLTKISKGRYRTQDGEWELFKTKAGWTFCSLDPATSKKIRSSTEHFSTLSATLKRVQNGHFLWEQPMILYPLRKTRSGIRDMFDFETCWVSQDGKAYIGKTSKGWKLVLSLIGPAAQERGNPQRRLLDWRQRHGLYGSLPTRKEVLARLETAQKIDPLHKLY